MVRGLGGGRVQNSPYSSVEFFATAVPYFPVQRYPCSGYLWDIEEDPLVDVCVISNW